MKKLGIIDKFIAAINSLAAALLLVSYLSTFVSPDAISFFSFAGLSVPFLILINVLFALYWLLSFKRPFLISTIVLLIGFTVLNRFYSFNEKKILLTDDIKLMSYNVRMFNLYNWIEDENTATNIYDFIKDRSPDILCIQEYHPSGNIGVNYNHKYVKIESSQNNFGHAIFSKYKIVNSGSLNFIDSGNNAIYADLLIKDDTVRIYNVHLESLKINPHEETINQENTEKFRIRVQDAFIKQTKQVALIENHMKETHLKSIICGDFNNNAFSWVYRKLKSDKTDAFEEAGKGFGKTYNYPFPFRIDFILSDPAFEVNNFKTFKVPYSDHYPIMARLNY